MKLLALSDGFYEDVSETFFVEYKATFIERISGLLLLLKMDMALNFQAIL